MAILLDRMTVAFLGLSALLTLTGCRKEIHAVPGRNPSELMFTKDAWFGERRTTLRCVQLISFRGSLSKDVLWSAWPEADNHCIDIDVLRIGADMPGYKTSISPKLEGAAGSLYISASNGVVEADLLIGARNITILSGR